VLNHPALTGMRQADIRALAGALEAPLAADRDQRIAAEREKRLAARGGREPQKKGGGKHSRISRLDHVLALRLREHLDLPLTIAGALLGLSPNAVSTITGRTARLLAASGITPPPAAPASAPVRTREALLAHAASAGITLTIPQPAHTGPRFTKPKRKPAPEPSS
jgi:hypothetical protein